MSSTRTYCHKPGNERGNLFRLSFEAGGEEKRKGGASETGGGNHLLATERDESAKVWGHHSGNHVHSAKYVGGKKGHSGPRKWRKR